MGAIFSSFYKTVDSSMTPEVLGASTVAFNAAVFLGYKAKDTPNGSDVFIDTGSAGIVVAPGVGESWSAPANTYADASQFNVDVANGGDGVLVLYTLADFKAFSDIESTIEDAIRKYLLTIGATLDDCSFTAGITDDERTEDNINAHVPTCTERIISSGVYDCQVVVTVRTAVGKAGESNQLDRHRLRTAYVRDLLVDPDAEEIISSLSHKLTVYQRSVREVVCQQRVEGRQWVSELTLTLTGSTSAIN